MHNHTFNKTILREYDIRGIVGKDLNLIDALYLGKSFATFLIKKKLKNVVIGYDGRHSSLQIEKELIKGLVSKGINIYRIGLVPTPLLYFSIVWIGGTQPVKIKTKLPVMTRNNRKSTIINTVDYPNFSSIATLGAFTNVYEQVIIPLAINIGITI